MNLFISLLLPVVCLAGVEDQPVSPDTKTSLEIVQKQNKQSTPQTVNKKSEQTIDLFDGKTLNGWVTLNDQPITHGWQVEDGMLHLKYGKKRAGHIKTAQKFEHFELEFEWRIAKGGNSGVKYLLKRLKSDRGIGYYGCEYQLLDDQHHNNGKTSNKTAGSLYDLYAADKKQKELKPLDQFNHSRIVIDHGRIEHWLNGKKIVSAEIGSEDWQKRIKQSKFDSVVGFAQGPGSIMLQDHKAEAWFKNIKLTPLP